MTKEKRIAYEQDIECAKRIAAREDMPMAIRQSVAADAILKILAIRGGVDYSRGQYDD